MGKGGGGKQEAEEGGAGGRRRRREDETAVGAFSFLQRIDEGRKSAFFRSVHAFMTFFRKRHHVEP